MAASAPTGTARVAGSAPTAAAPARRPAVPVAASASPDARTRSRRSAATASEGPASAVPPPAVPFKPGPAADRGPAAKAPLRPGTIANDRFKTARQPKRDADFYDRDYTDERDTTEVPDGIRLQKVLAQAGVASRRACEEMIGDGRVTVDGQVVRRFGARVDPAKQIIHVDGKRIPTAPDLVYSPSTSRSASSAPWPTREGRPSPGRLRGRLAPSGCSTSGRLDTETEGLHPAHQRRRAGQPAHPPELRRAEEVLGEGARADRRATWAAG